jgi:stage V sporulation protein G
LNITEVRVKLMHHRTDRLRAFCSVTIDNDFVVHDLRVIEGRKGMFVAMPSRKLSDNCPKCNAKNELRAKFCGECGGQLDPARAAGVAVREKLHVDVAHPINTPCRELLQKAVLDAYREEANRAGEGLPPLREYATEGLDELGGEYGEVEPPEEGAEPEYEQAAALRNEQASAGVGPHAGAEPEPPADSAPEAAPAEQPSEPRGAGEGRQDLPRPPRARRQRGTGGFGEGIL